jgi:uncharacterized protein YcbX
MAGEEIAAAQVAAHGLAGDRAHTLVDGRERGGRLSARAVPSVLEWAATYPDHPDDALEAADPPPPVVTAPDGRCFGFDDPELPGAIAADLDRAIALRRLPSGDHDRRGTVLVTFEATRRAVEDALGRPLELRRFRPNLHLELDASPFAEEGWSGRRIAAGEVTMRVREPCERCAVPTRDPGRPGERWPQLLRWLFAVREGAFGVIAEVERPGRVAGGDQAGVWEVAAPRLSPARRPPTSRPAGDR